MPAAFPSRRLAREDLHGLVARWAGEREVVAPVREANEVHWRPVTDAEQVTWDYASTMLPPSKVMYKPLADVARFTRALDAVATGAVEPGARPSLLLAVHPCDLHGILVLERTVKGRRFVDPSYAAWRAQTLIVGLNCRRVGELCFCASFGTGPFYSRWMDQGPSDGCDLLLTELGGDFLVEIMSRSGEELLAGARMTEASEADFAERDRQEESVRSHFRKKLEVGGLPELLLRNLEHPVWERVGEGRCLSCTNCTMVCPTCYCYDLQDRSSLDLRETIRARRWDSCQDRNFAAVHFGNFRATRKSRLRQFVCHKLCYWVAQHGCFGCVGCGRCIRLCPTGIDLAEIAGEIRRTEKAEGPKGKAEG